MSLIVIWVVIFLKGRLNILFVIEGVIGLMIIMVFCFSCCWMFLILMWWILLFKLKLILLIMLRGWVRIVLLLIIFSMGEFGRWSESLEKIL